MAARGLPDAYRCWISFIAEEDRDALLNGSRDDWALEDYRAIWRPREGAHPLDRLLDLNLRTYLLDDLLVKADRMSMAHALEVRSPFLDAELIAYTDAAAAETQGAGPVAQARAEGGRCRPAARGDPRARRSAASACRSTAGSARTCAPTWPARSGARTPGCSAHLVPGDALDRLLAEHARGTRNHGHALWTLLTLEVFLRREGW